MNRRVLLVDDDERVLASYTRSLRLRFELEVALGPMAALKMVEEQGPYAVVVADMQMPGMNGIAMLGRILEIEPDTVRIMLTGNADQATAVDAVNHGRIFRFLSKPCAVADMTHAIEGGIEQYRLITAEKELLEKTLTGSVTVLTDLLAMADPLSFGWAQSIMDYTLTVGKMVGMEDAWALRVGTLLSNIGELTIPEPLREKVRRGQPLSPTELDLVARLPEVSARLLERIPRLEEVVRIVRYQNKGYDGTGFPYDDVQGELLPLGARVLKCVRDFGQVESVRKDTVVAVEELRLHYKQYDPKVLEALEALVSPEDKDIFHPTLVTLMDLAEGMTLVEDITSIDGILLFAKGSRISQSHIEKLHNFARLSGVKEPFTVVRSKE